MFARPRLLSNAVVGINRHFHASARSSGKVLLALYPDPVGGFPPEYARAKGDIPKITAYPDGQSTPSPKSIDFQPGDLLGCVSGELGLRKYVESMGHELVVTSSKDGDDCEMDKHLADAEIVISQPFYPYYLTKERMDKAKNLKLAVTAGIGSDHVNLDEAIRNKVDVVEVTFCNSISVAEHVVMHILALVRNYIPSHEMIKSGGWGIADCVSRAYDIEGMKVGTVAAGRIGLAVLERMKPFGCELHYTDRHRLDPIIEKRLGLIYHSSPESLASACDVVTINCPLHSETENLFDERMIRDNMKRGSYIVNTARGKICDRDAIAKALEDGHLAGYAGDVWFPQPAPKDHPWRSMPHQAMTPHTSGTTLSAQARYASGVREILECYWNNKKIRDEYLIVKDGKLAGTGAHSYAEGDATKGSEHVLNEACA
eukprot:g2851.t1